MKRIAFVFVGLALIAIHGFANGDQDPENSAASGRATTGRRAGANRGESSQYVIETPDLDEVSIPVPPPRRNRGIQRAGSPVYALPAEALVPEAERIPPPVYAISGVRGQEIREPWEVVDIVIELPEKESFSRGILEGEDVSDWIENLPDGLEAKAHKVKKGATSIKMYISGIPTVTMRERIRVTIPGTYLTRRDSREFVSPTEEASFRSWQEEQTAAEQNN
ncbi:MAG: hypothetical protein LBG25_03325 [Spirochaetaceae bacterium]|nr:hypothetical protein [Spirochaetaceae bacterium]